MTKHTEETKRKISVSKTGKSNASKGKPSWKKGLHFKEMPSKKCCICKSIYHKEPTRSYKDWEKRSTCSKSCGIILGANKRRGFKFSEESLKKLRDSHIGQKAWNDGIPHHAIKGEKNHNWKGGVSKENSSERQNMMKTLEYKAWRKAVFERDNFTCQNCQERGGKLNADHIRPYSLYPELRLVIENGRTLCVECHNLIGYNFFKENNPRKQLKEAT